MIYVIINQFEILSNSLCNFLWIMERGKIKLLMKSQWWRSSDLYCSLEQKEKSGTLVSVHSVVSDSLLKKYKHWCCHYLKIWSFVPYGVLELILIFLNTILKYHFDYKVSWCPLNFVLKMNASLVFPWSWPCFNELLVK